MLLASQHSSSDGKQVFHVKHLYLLIKKITTCCQITYKKAFARETMAGSASNFELHTAIFEYGQILAQFPRLLSGTSHIVRSSLLLDLDPTPCS